jgi:HEAT repeat protein
VLYFLSGFQFLNLVHLNWLFIFVLAAWIWVAYKMYEAYRNILKSKLSQLKIATDSSRDPVKDLICSALSSVQPALFHQVCDFFEKAEPAKIDIAIQQAHKNASSPLKEMIAQKIEERTLAPDADEVSFEQLTEQVNSQDALVRLSVARLLGSSGRYNTYKLLIGLMKDPDLAVKKAAVISSGKLRRYELWPFIIENLVKTDSFGVANMALRNIGEPILADLDRFFDRINEFKAVQLAIIRIYESIGGARAIKLLREKINHPGSDVRYQVMLSLSNLAYHATPSEIPYIKDTLEELVSTIVWLLASRNDLMDKPNSERLHNAILQEIEEKKEQVLLLLSLLYESGTIRHIREHIESKDANAKIYALEIGDMMLDDEIKSCFFRFLKICRFRKN